MQLRRSALVTNSFGNSITVSASADYLGTLRSRVGVAYGRWLALATADLAHTTINHSGAGVTYSGSDSKVGCAGDGGVEWISLLRAVARVSRFQAYNGVSAPQKRAALERDLVDPRLQLREVRRLALTLSRHVLSLSRFGRLLKVTAPLTLAAKRPFARDWLRFRTLKKAKNPAGTRP
jgi:hypothetical protein